MYDLVLRNALIVPIEPRSSAFAGYVGITDGTIRGVGDGVPDAPGAAEIDASGMAMLPGLVDAHIHPSPSLFRGLLNHLTIDENLGDPFVAYVHVHLSTDEAKLSARLTLTTARSCGTTCVGLMEYLRPDAASAVASELRLSGTSAIFPAGEWKPIFERAREAGLCPWLMGPNENHEDYNERFLTKLAALAESLDVRVHMHVQETRQRVDIVRAATGLSPIQYLDRIGLLQHAYAAHCTVVDDTDIQLLAARGVPVAVTPTSEAMLSDGVGPVKRMRDAGITVGLGTDGAAWTGGEDMFREMALAAALSRAWDRANAIDAVDVLEMATIGSARAMGVADRVGSIAIGKRADLVLIDLSRPHLRPLFFAGRFNVFDLLAFSASGSDVARVIVGGETVVDRTVSVRGGSTDALQELANRLLSASATTGA